MVVVVLTPEFVELLWYISLSCAFTIRAMSSFRSSFSSYFLIPPRPSFFQFFLKVYSCLACQVVNCSLFQFNVYKIYYSICTLKLPFYRFLC